MPQLRNTRQRETIRQVFETIDRPLSPDEVWAECRRQIPGIGIATIYRNLKTMTEEKWLVPVAIPGEPPRYERAGKKHHHHFHCHRCGKVYELAQCRNQWDHLAPKGFTATGHELLLYGTCAGCNATAGAA